MVQCDTGVDDAMETIVASYRNTYDVAMRASLRARHVWAKSGWHRTLKYGLIIVFTVAVICATILTLFPSLLPEVNRIALIGVLLGSVCAIAFYWLVATMLYRILMKLVKPIFHWFPSSNKYVVLHIDNERIVTTVEGQAQHHKMWRGLLKVIRTPAGFFLGQPSHWSIGWWIPLEAFESEDEIERFAHLARNNVPKYVEFLE